MENIGRNQTPNIIKVLTKYMLLFKSHKKYDKIKKLYKIYCLKKLPKKESLN